MAKAARHMGVTRQTLHPIISGKTSITPEMALRLGKFCGNGAGLWLRMQQSYDLWHAKHALKVVVDKISSPRVVNPDDLG
ncbi:MAG: HigA family addiction module antitoxin [Acidobacteriota bacterium]